MKRWKIVAFAIMVAVMAPMFVIAIAGAERNVRQGRMILLVGPDWIAFTEDRSPGTIRYERRQQGQSHHWAFDDPPYHVDPVHADHILQNLIDAARTEVRMRRLEGSCGPSPK